MPVIVLAQFLCSSVWFAVNAVVKDMGGQVSDGSSLTAQLTISIQLGFILGTLVFSIFAFADRFSPSKVFFVSSLLAAFFNIALLIADSDQFTIIVLRFLTGFFLAGIYPVGMKIAADYFGKNLNKSLGFLVGALVLGTALPNLIKHYSMNLFWQTIIITTSLLSVLGGLVLLITVPDGPFKVQGQKMKFADIQLIFGEPKFKAAAFGYFGHMWELYSFWAFVPFMLSSYFQNSNQTNTNLNLLSFFVIASGSVGCVLAGYLGKMFSLQNIAKLALSISCFCCICFPLVLVGSSSAFFLIFMIVWGLAVIADSPLFSTLVAQNAPPAAKGSVLTLVNCIGFGLTILSIQTVHLLLPLLGNYTFMLLGIGPMLGIWALQKQKE